MKTTIDVLKQFHEKAERVERVIAAYDAAAVDAIDGFNLDIQCAIAREADREIQLGLADLKFQINQRFYQRTHRRA